MAQSFDVQPVDASFGAVITGVRIPELDQPTWQALHDTWLKYALLIFPGQFLKKDEQIAFARRFGPLEFEMGAVSNVREDGTLRRRGRGRRRRQDPQGQRGLARRFDLQADPGQGRGVQRRGRADGRRPYRLGRHAGGLRRARRRRREARIAPLQAYHSLHYSQGAHRPRAEDGHRGLSPAGLRGRRERAAAAGEDPSRHRPQVAADRPPCARHSGSGAGGVRRSCCRS